MKAPPTVVEIAVEAEMPFDRSRLREIVDEMIENDAHATAMHDAETGQTVIRATNETHLCVLTAALSAKAGGKIVVGSPQVAYREAFSRTVETDYTYKNHLGPTYQFGRVIIKVEPAARGQGFRFVNATKPADLPPDYIPAIERGILDAANTGTTIGAPLIDFTATLVGGAHHDIDSSAIAFEIAARGAIQKAAATAGTKVLEPIMKVAVVTRPGWRTAVIDNLIGRRAVILMENEPGIVVATAPMATLFDVENDLAEITGGEASTAMLFDRYAEISPTVTNPDDNFPAAAALTA